MQIHRSRRAAVLAAFVLLGLVASTSAAPTAFRITDLNLRDPHVFLDFFGQCVDVTDGPGFAFNDNLDASIQTDTDGDGRLDQNYLLIFDPLDQVGAGGDCMFMDGVWCTPPVWQTACWVGWEGSFIYPATYTNLAGGAPGIIQGSVVHSYTPAIAVPSPPYFFTYFDNLHLDLGGIPVTFRFADMTANYVGNPATQIDGLIRGFIPESVANRTILPASLPVVGGQPLSILFPGGSGNCAPWSDKDVYGGVTGWHVYLNFTAVKVPWYPSPTAVPEGAPTLRLDAPHPNPFNPSTEIRYVLPSATRVQIAVYDASGRVVRVLADEDQVKGEHSVHWDGRDTRGGIASSGVYFLRLVAGAETRTQKMVLLK
jgi:hypothetical protein